MNEIENRKNHREKSIKRKADSLKRINKIDKTPKETENF